MNNKELRTILNTCYLCNEESNNLTCISDNYIKFEDLYIPYCEILRDTLGFEVNINILEDKNKTIFLSSSSKQK